MFLFNCKYKVTKEKKIKLVKFINKLYKYCENINFANLPRGFQKFINLSNVVLKLNRAK